MVVGWSNWSDPILWVRGQQAEFRKVSQTEEAKVTAGQTHSEQLPDTREHLHVGAVLRSVFLQSWTLIPKENRVSPSNSAPPHQRHQAAEAYNQLCHSFQIKTKLKVMARQQEMKPTL